MNNFREKSKIISTQEYQGFEMKMPDATGNPKNSFIHEWLFDNNGKEEKVKLGNRINQGDDGYLNKILTKTNLFSYIFFFL